MNKNINIVLVAFLLLIIGCRKDNYRFKKDIIVHPKNFKELLFVDLINIKSDTLKVNIFNIQGNTVFNQTSIINNHYFEQFKLDLNSLNSGVYFCNAITYDTSVVVKLIKE